MLKRFFNTITAYAQPDKQLKVSELRYRRLFESAQDGILILDAETGKITDSNPFIEKILGYSKEDLLGKELWEIGFFKDIANSKRALVELQTKGYVYYKDLPLEAKDGHSVDVEFVSNLYVVDSEKKIQCNIRNITDRKKAEQIILVQAVALNAAAHAIVITDIKGTIILVNPAFTKLTGYSSQEAVGKSVNILKSGKQDTAFYQNLWNTILSGKIWKGEVVNRRKDGSLYMEEQTITPVQDKEGVITHFIAIKQDVTLRNTAEKEATSKNLDLERLSKAQEETKQAMLNVMEDLESAKAVIEIEKAKAEATLDSIGEGLISVDNNKKITVVNKEAEKLLGKSMQDLQHQDITTLLLEDESGNTITPDKRPSLMSLTSGKRVSTTSLFFVRADKTRFPMAINVNPIILKGNTIGVVATFRDISREKEIDRAKSEFVSLASHQLRTPLGIAKWYIEAINEQGYLNNTPAVVKDYLNEIYKSNERLLALVRELLSISRIDQGRVRDVPKSVNITELIKNIIKAVTILAEKNDISIHLELKDSQIPVMNIDPLRFQEAFENLLTNAIVYSHPSGKINVVVDKHDNKVIISVMDTGIGMSPEDIKRIGTKFYRSEKASGYNPQGSGLGLYVVKSYVEGWGGHMSIESVEGKGSTFTINLPIS